MTVGILRVALHRVVGRRPVHLSAITKVDNGNFYPPTKGDDPNINYDFFETPYNPLPLVPRTIGFDGEMKVLKEKEKGDWKNLSLEERMDLYNMYFSKSMADMNRETDEHKSVYGAVAILMGFGFFMYWFTNKFVLPPPPRSTDPEWCYASIKRQLQLHSDPITGYASMWDYENNCWKK